MFLTGISSAYALRLSLSTKGSSMNTQSQTNRLLEAAHETAEAYVGVISQLCARHRVITCKDDLQWILQHRKNGGAERPWRGVGYFRTRNALIRVCATFCGRIDPAAIAVLAALPSHFGGAV
ncbi:MAG: hypothetical protein HKN98_00175 [Silicimonas sp.]|nr:hypothetical protein [Silicimonas sp.]